LKEKMDPLGIECVVVTSEDRRSEGSENRTVSFIKKHFGMDK